MPPILEVASLYSGYDRVPIVRDMNLEVHEGEIVALLGPNGAGKTTTLLTISGILSPISGAIAFSGRSTHRVPAHKIARAGCAHVAEDRGLFLSLTVRENFLVTIAKNEIPAAVRNFPALAQLMNRRAGLLSGGELQMLAIARALASRPRLLMIDEMSLGLAPIITTALMEIVAKIPGETGCAVLLVEQHVNLALRIAHRGYVLNRGRLVAQGRATDLVENHMLLEHSYLGRAEGMEPAYDV